MKIYELLDSPKKWIKGAFAKNNEGDTCSPHSESACCWCLIGACVKCHTYQSAVIMSKIQHVVGHNINVYNDLPETKYEDVISLCKELDV